MNCIVGRMGFKDAFKQIIKDLIKFFLIVTSYCSGGIFKKYTIESNRLLLKELSLDDITDRYISWLNDPVVNQFLESRFVKHTYKSNQKFIKEIDQDPYTVLFGIFDRAVLASVWLT